eukprot:gene15288-18101_t
MNNNNNNHEEEEDDVIQKLDKDELIDNLVSLRDAYYDVKDRYKDAKKNLNEKNKQVEIQRRLLAEREDLLLQLQWEPDQDSSYLYQVGQHDTNQANQLKMKSILDQMRVMEKGIFDRDDKIRVLERAVEDLTIKQIDGADAKAPVSTSADGVPSPIQANVTQKISEYPLNYKEPTDTVEVVSAHPEGIERTPSFWETSTTYVSQKIGWGQPELK